MYVFMDIRDSSFNKHIDPFAQSLGENGNLKKNMLWWIKVNLQESVKRFNIEVWLQYQSVMM